MGHKQHGVGRAGPDPAPDLTEASLPLRSQTDSEVGSLTSYPLFYLVSRVTLSSALLRVPCQKPRQTCGEM